MSEPGPMAERHGRILAELSELGLSLARSLHERAVAAEDARSAADLGLAFHRISRAVRQTVALEAKLARDEAQAVATAARAAEEGPAPRLSVRDQQTIDTAADELRATMQEIIAEEVTDETDREMLLDVLEDGLERRTRSLDFWMQSFETQVEQLCEVYGLPAPEWETDAGDDDADGAGDGDADACDPRPGDPRPGDPRPGDLHPGDLHPGDPVPWRPRPGDTDAGDWCGAPEEPAGEAAPPQYALPPPEGLDWRSSA